MLFITMDYMFAPATTADKGHYVVMLLEDFLMDFQELYPEKRLTPKMHFMINLASYMKWYVYTFC